MNTDYPITSNAPLQVGDQILWPLDDGQNLPLLVCSVNYLNDLPDLYIVRNIESKRVGRLMAASVSKKHYRRKRRQSEFYPLGQKST